MAPQIIARPLDMDVQMRIGLEKRKKYTVQPLCRYLY